MTAEPRMEELLASIRRAIHEDIGDIPAPVSGQPEGMVLRGAMRELRVKLGNEMTAAAAEIQELRDRINRNGAGEVPGRVSPPLLAAPAPALARPSGGAAIPGGEVGAHRPRRILENLPPHTLRPSLAEGEIRNLEPLRHESPRRFSREAETVTPEIPKWQERLVEPEAEPHPVDRGLLSAEASAAAGAAFNRLANTVLNRDTTDRSIEDITRELLRGMLKQWLDDNLPGLAERLVREEIERVARRGR